MPANENALVIIHAQEDYIGNRTHLNAAAENIAYLTQKRPQGVGHVVHVLTVEAPDGAVMSGENFTTQMNGHEGISALHQGIDVRPGDLVILTPARDANLFNVPGALEALHERGITNTAFAGFSTSQCVAASVAGGAQNGFNLSVVADATGSSAFSGGGRSGPANPSNTALGLRKLKENFGAQSIISEQLNGSDWQPNAASESYVAEMVHRDTLAERYVQTMDQTVNSGATEERLQLAREMVAAGFNEPDFHNMFESERIGKFAANDFRVTQGGQAAIADYLHKEAQPEKDEQIRQKTNVDTEKLEDSLSNDRKRLLRDGSLDHILGEADKPLDAESAEVLRAKVRAIQPEYPPLKSYYNSIAGRIDVGTKPSAVMDAFYQTKSAINVLQNQAPSPKEKTAASESSHFRAEPISVPTQTPVAAPPQSAMETTSHAPVTIESPVVIEPTTRLSTVRVGAVGGATQVLFVYEGLSNIAANAANGHMAEAGKQIVTLGAGIGGGIGGAMIGALPPAGAVIGVTLGASAGYKAGYDVADASLNTVNAATGWIEQKIDSVTGGKISGAGSYINDETNGWAGWAWRKTRSAVGTGIRYTAAGFTAVAGGIGGGVAGAIPPVGATMGGFVGGAMASDAANAAMGTNAPSATMALVSNPTKFGLDVAKGMVVDNAMAAAYDVGLTDQRPEGRLSTDVPAATQEPAIASMGTYQGNGNRAGRMRAVQAQANQTPPDAQATSASASALPQADAQRPEQQRVAIAQQQPQRRMAMSISPAGPG